MNRWDYVAIGAIVPLTIFIGIWAGFIWALFWLAFSGEIHLHILIRKFKKELKKPFLKIGK